MADQIKNILWRIVYILIAIGILGAWLYPEHRPRVGDACGPAHHWRYSTTSINTPDLSCEPDAP